MIELFARSVGKTYRSNTSFSAILPNGHGLSDRKENVSYLKIIDITDLRLTSQRWEWNVRNFPVVDYAVKKGSKTDTKIFESHYPFYLPLNYLNDSRFESASWLCLFSPSTCSVTKATAAESSTIIQQILITDIAEYSELPECSHTQMFMGTVNYNFQCTYGRNVTNINDLEAELTVKEFQELSDPTVTSKELCRDLQINLVVEKKGFYGIDAYDACAWDLPTVSSSSGSTLLASLRQINESVIFSPDFEEVIDPFVDSLWLTTFCSCPLDAITIETITKALRSSPFYSQQSLLKVDPNLPNFAFHRRLSPTTPIVMSGSYPNLKLEKRAGAWLQTIKMNLVQIPISCAIENFNMKNESNLPHLQTSNKCKSVFATQLRLIAAAVKFSLNELVMHSDHLRENFRAVPVPEVPTKEVHAVADVNPEIKTTSTKRQSEILVAGSFLEAFPDVVAKLNEQYSIHCVDCSISFSVSILLDPQQALMIICEDFLSTKEMLRGKMHDIIAASTQYSRLCIIVLSESPSSFSKELLLQLSQSVARLRCQLCIRSCTSNGENLVKMIAAFHNELLQQSTLAYIKPELYCLRKYLGLFNVLPIFHAQAYALQKLPCINIFLAAAMLVEFPFHELLTSSLPQLTDQVRKHSLFGHETEEKLRIFVNAINQLL